VHDFQYAFRNSPDLMKTVALIKKGSSNAMKIQSLFELSALGKKNSELLTAIQFDIGLLDSAHEAAETLASLLAGVHNEKNATNETLDFRNRSFSYLKMAVDEIRKCGKYIFWKDEIKMRRDIKANMCESNIARLF
jgi:hypothetical protein